MAKKKGLSYEEKMIAALNGLPNPIEDKRHRIFIYLEDDRARSNESRYEHIMASRHDLTPKDIKLIPRGIKTATLKKDKERADTFNIYIQRKGHIQEYIKISVELNFNKSNMAKIKTIFIAKSLK